MEIKTLEKTPLSEIVTCFNQAFADYFVPISATEEAMCTRWQAGRVDYSLSVGAFENEQLIAFIITGVDEWEGKKTAYNAGTGVIPAFRGQKLVAQLYAYALPLFKETGIEQCTLEVITANEKAIKAYQQIGFTVGRTLHCLNGMVSPEKTNKTFEYTFSPEFDLESLDHLQPYAFSWDNNNRGIMANRAAYECHKLSENGNLKAYALINPANGYLSQFGFDKSNPEIYGTALLREVAVKQSALRINNVDAASPETIRILENLGMANTISQYEMHLLLS